MSVAAEQILLPAALSPGPRVVVSALGVTQIVAWASTYYLLAVLAKPIAEETGWPLPEVVAGFSAALLVSCLVSPRVGRTIDRFGGRLVLAGSSVLMAAGQAIVGLASSVEVYFLGWLVMGAGMGAGLYDAAFATLGRLYGEGARRSITVLTLWGGFASAVGLVAGALLLERLGWRGTCLAYAAVQLGIALPIHLLLVPRQEASPSPARATVRGPVAVDGLRRRALLLHGGVLVLASLTASVISVHLVTILQARGLDLATAVALGALIGPAQVLSRIVEMRLGARHHPIWTMLCAIALVAAGVTLLAASPFAGAALLLYGCGHGIYSIARGTLPLALFGREGYASLMGRLAVPALLAAALGPALAALVLERAGPEALLAVVCGLALANVALVLVLRGTAARTT